MISALRLLTRLLFAWLLFGVETARAEKPVSVPCTMGCDSCCDGTLTTYSITASVDFVLLLDRSGSMDLTKGGRPPSAAAEGAKWKRLAHEARGFLEQIKSGPAAMSSQVQGAKILFPSEEATASGKACGRVASERLTPIGQVDVAALSTLKPKGWTPLSAAFDAAGETLARNDATRRVVIVATDGGNTCLDDGTPVWNVQDADRNDYLAECAAANQSEAVKAQCEARDSVRRLLDQGVDVFFFPIGDSGGAGTPALRGLIEASELYAKGLQQAPQVGRQVPHVEWERAEGSLSTRFYEIVKDRACTLGAFAADSPARRQASFVHVDQELEPPLGSCRDGDGWCVDGASHEIRLRGRACEMFLKSGIAQVAVPAPPAAPGAPTATPAAGGTGGTAGTAPVSGEAPTCEWRQVDEDWPTCPHGRRHHMQLFRSGVADTQRDKPGEPWITCPPFITEIQPLRSPTACRGSGRRVVTCYDSIPNNSCKDETEISAADVCDGVDYPTVGVVIRDPPVSGAPWIEPLHTVPPGDRSVYRLRLASPRIGSTGGVGFAIGVHPFRVWRATRRSGAPTGPETPPPEPGVPAPPEPPREIPDPFYNSDFGLGLGLLDSLELSTSLATGQRLAGAVTTTLGDIFSLGTSVDLLELGNTRNGAAAVIPGGGAAAVAGCVKDGVESFARENASRRPMLQEEADRILEDCKLSDSTFFLGPNAVMDVQKIGQVLHVTQWHPSLLGQGRLLNDTLRVTAQVGGDFYATDIVQTIGRGTGRSSVAQTLRVDVNPWDALSLKFEAAAHEHVTRRGSYATVGGVLDFGLPLGLVVSPGWRSSVYDGVPENAGFVNIGLSEANQEELRPLVEYLRRTTGVPGTTQGSGPNAPPPTWDPAVPPPPTVAPEPEPNGSPRWR